MLGVGQCDVHQHDDFVDGDAANPVAVASAQNLAGVVVPVGMAVSVGMRVGVVVFVLAAVLGREGAAV